MCVVCVYVGCGGGSTWRGKVWQVEVDRSRTGGDRWGGGPSMQRCCARSEKTLEGMCQGRVSGGERLRGSV